MATTTEAGSGVYLAGYPELCGSLNGGSTERVVACVGGALWSSYCPAGFHSCDHSFFVISLGQRAEISDDGPLRGSQTGWSRDDLEQAVCRTETGLGSESH